MTLEGGPYIQVACFADYIIRAVDGKISIIGIVDVVNHVKRGQNPPDIMEPFTYTLNLIVILKSGHATGRNTLRIVPEKPNGETLPPHTISTRFEGGERGSAVIVDMTITFELEGLYMFDIFLEEEKLTAIPLRINYNRVFTQ
jgi:hypothetical protein